MRVLTLASLLLLAACTAQAQSMASRITQAEEAYGIEMGKLAQDFRQAFAEALGSAKKVEVYLLDFEMTDAEDAKRDSYWAVRLAEDQFPIVPYGRQAKILKRKMLTADEIQMLMPSLQRTLAGEDDSGGAMCHFPIHGLRIWEGEDIVFQTSFCHHCHNFYMTYPFRETGWAGLNDPTLGSVLGQLMPIPQKERDRFEKKWGNQKKDAQE